MKTEEKIIYYHDELNDDFADLNVNLRPLGKKYKYMRTGIFFKIFEFLFYYTIMIPVVYMLQKLYNHQKFANRKILKKAKKDGYFIVSNHTQVQSDSYIGTLGAYPKKCFIISNPQVLSISGLRLGMQAYGVIPLGSNLKEKKTFYVVLRQELIKKRQSSFIRKHTFGPTIPRYAPLTTNALVIFLNGKSQCLCLQTAIKKEDFLKNQKLLPTLMVHSTPIITLPIKKTQNVFEILHMT